MILILFQRDNRVVGGFGFFSCLFFLVECRNFTLLYKMKRKNKAVQNQPSVVSDFEISSSGILTMFVFNIFQPFTFYLLYFVVTVSLKSPEYN